MACLSERCCLLDSDADIFAQALLPACGLYKAALFVVLKSRSAPDLMEHFTACRLVRAPREKCRCDPKCVFSKCVIRENGCSTELRVHLRAGLERLEEMYQY